MNLVYQKLEWTLELYFPVSRSSELSLRLRGKIDYLHGFISPYMNVRLLVVSQYRSLIIFGKHKHIYNKDFLNYFVFATKMKLEVVVIYTHTL